MLFNNLFAEFAKSLGLAQIKPLASNHYRLFFDQMEVHFFCQDKDTMVIHSILGALPQDEQRRFKLLKVLARINIAYRKSLDKNIICLDAAKKELSFFQRLVWPKLDAKQLAQTTEAFLNQLETLRKLFRPHSAQSAGKVAGPE